MVCRHEGIIGFWSPWWDLITMYYYAFRNRRDIVFCLWFSHKPGVVCFDCVHRQSSCAEYHCPTTTHHTSNHSPLPSSPHERCITSCIFLIKCPQTPLSALANMLGTLQTQTRTAIGRSLKLRSPHLGARGGGERPYVVREHRVRGHNVVDPGGEDLFRGSLADVQHVPQVLDLVSHAVYIRWE